MHFRYRDLFFTTIFSRVLVVILLFPVFSCRSTKYVPGGKYLLTENKVNIDKKNIRNDEFLSYINPKPNKRILGLRFYLGLYNLSDKDKNNWINRSLRTIGEEPVLYDQVQSEKTRQQLKLYLENKGYFDAIVEVNPDTTLKNEKKAKIYYNITVNDPYRIGAITYLIEDTAIMSLFMEDTIQSKLKTGDRFDVDVLAAERERIEKYLHNKGYYRFSKEEHLEYIADSADRIINLRLVLRKYRVATSNGEIVEMQHIRYRIGQVYVNTNFRPQLAVQGDTAMTIFLDTVVAEGINIIYEGKNIVRPGTIVYSTFIIPGEYYNKDNVNLSYRHLSSLSIFRLVNIEFSEPDSGSGGTERLLDCHIQLTPFSLQSYTAEPEITNSSGNIGGGGILTYQHRNLFMGAENFNFRIRGAVEAIKKTESRNIGNLLEFGTDATLKIPKFLLPFRTDQFIKKYNPQTSITLAYNYQRRPEYTRTVANLSFGYAWKGNINLTHNLNPVDLNFVQIPRMSAQFSTWLKDKYIAYSYQPHMVSVTSYGVTFSNQRIQSIRDFIYIKYYVESAGNLMYLLYKGTKQSQNNGTYEIFNTPFSQYVRNDINFIYNNIIDDNTSLVYRVFAGIGIPYKNSTALPFEKKYFSGGANSVRAWQVRDLGPGSYRELDPGFYPNQTADIKLEGNVEYRFDLFWLLKGAFFVDAGNIWALSSKDERPGAVFEPGKFYKDIAVGTGFGTRFDFSFFIFRLDLGIKIKNPVFPEGQKWVFGNRRLARRDFVLNFGIGYPF